MITPKYILENTALQEQPSRDPSLTTMTPARTMRDYALYYVKCGFKVLPLKPGGKIPLTEHGLKDATTTQLEVKEYWSKWPDANIGIRTDGFVVLDLDLKNGGLKSKAAIEARYGQLPRTRVHRTGGGGEHWIYNQPSSANVRNTTEWSGYKGVDIRANGGYIVAPPSTHESGNRYEVLDDAPVAPAPPWLIELAQTRAPAPTLDATTGETNFPIPRGKQNIWLFSRARAYRGKGDSEEAILRKLEIDVLRCVDQDPANPFTKDHLRKIARSAAGYSVNSPESGVDSTCVYIRSQQTCAEANRNKNAIENATGDSGTNGKTQQAALSQVIEDWIRSTSGWFDTPELDRDLGINSIADKNNRREAMLRLESKGIIERHPKIAKQFRYVNTRVTSLNFKAASNAGILPIKWPLGIENYVNIFPGNMAVIAGAPNAGKTALLLRFIYLNHESFPIYYFCSEMGDVELRDRLDKFPGMDINDWHFEAIERASDFADVVKPDCVNVIDYLEMTTELFQINNYLTAISHKLGSGIAIVAVQKKEDAKYGRGQEFGLEKPKLYLTMDRGKLTVVKGKSWAKKNVDPHGLTIRFRIIDGCDFKVTQDWDWVK